MKSVRMAMLLIIFWSFQVAGAHAAILDEVKETVENYYYGTQPTNLKILSSIEEVEKQLDEYSEYLTEEEYRALTQSLEGPVTSIPNVALNSLSILPNVSSKMLYGQVGYIRLHSFSTDAKEKVEVEWKSLQKLGAKQVILDLRYNGGGYVESANKLIGMFKNIPTGYNMMSRISSELVPITPSIIQFPINPYVLMNSYSASASEMVVVAIKDSKAGTLFGQQTFGKGSIQTFHELSDGGAMKLTTANFKGPKGTIVNKVGIKPDVEVVAGKEVSVAHYTQIEQQLNIKLYKKTSNLEQVPTNKTFTIRFSQPMDFTETESLPKIELVKMGGKAQPITWKMKDENNLIITPTQLLENNESYLLIVHPKFSDQKGVAMRRGSYTKVTVEPL